MFSEPLVIKNFVEDNIIHALNEWCLSNYKNTFFRDARMGIPRTRMTTRYSPEWMFEFPKEAYELKSKIVNHLGFQNALQPDFKDGIVCGIGFDDGDIYEHLDPIYYENTDTIHCNIITQKSEVGGVTIINDIEYETDPNDLLVYKVSAWPHRVTTIKGNTPRILWVFGFSIKHE